MENLGGEKIRSRWVSKIYMKILFLDCDGVLNRGDIEECKIRPEIARRVRKILSATGAKAVLSSTWRRSPILLQKVRNECCEVYGTTPLLLGDGMTSEQKRGYEVGVYLSANKDIEKYAILDDAGEFGPLQIPHYFKCDSHIGLTEEIKEKVVEHLL